MRTALFIGLLVACGPTPIAEAASLPSWRKLDVPGGPSARSGHGMVYDSIRKRVIVFGGNNRTNGRQWFNDTWSFDGKRWTELKPAHRPPARAAMAIAFDAARDRVVVFGGARETAGPLGDTWEFDGSDWKQMTPFNSPPARWSPASAWDATTRRTVIFGGWVNMTASDTWEYDGTTWQKVAGAGGPPDCGYPIATFDPRTGHVALFSDEIVDGQSVAHLWRFTGVVWEEQPLTPLPDSPGQTAMASHPVHGLVHYGTIGRTGWTWFFDGKKASLGTLAPAPAAVNSQGMVSDGQRVLLFGGGADDGRERNELWAFE